MIAAFLRRLLWRIAFVLTGVRVTGRLPRGGCVVVANHSSHADTAALLAALDAGHRPRVAAAADYWFRGGFKASVCRSLAAGFAVRRGGGGSADLAAAAELLRTGHAVVIFPEGTRTRDGELGDFHSGAARLAAQAGVPVVPVGIQGTRALLPAHGRFHRSPVSVRIGAPLEATDVAATTEQARASVDALVSRPRERDSRLRQRVAARTAGRRGVLVVGGLSFAEALSWPLLPETALAVALLAAPAAWRRLIPVAVAGSMLGGLVALLLAAHGVVAPAPLTTDRMRATVVQQVADEGAAAVRHQPYDGIPYKVYAAEAGRAGVDPGPFLVESVASRGVRIAGVGMLLALAGWVLARRRQWYAAVLGAGTVCFGVGLGLVVASWS
ncbi:lysophospholipid acyltransferase family protein [Luteipulveratus sp. YIM 133132]|uniref:lysophospholipid acyltransferase family protein n=1 Tax=Luteipulveratus flavus TaxID=3031728 RepID=UPI0023AEC01D|nr:lysophospholipid acyltransferase family protein [Luteipulveratus sp. YIM 133132]MDE9364718.1 lysophospholipid acyltransferase family protein [Luteipulveratus sp. YIM 133132]